MHTNADSTCITIIVAKIIAFFLLALSCAVLLAWHYPNFFSAIYKPVIAMAYSTAICFLLCGMAVLALSWECMRLVRILALMILTICCLTCIEFCCKPDLDINIQLMFLVAEIPEAPVRMALTTAVSLILASLSFLLLSFSRQSIPDKKFILITFLNLLIIAIAAIALLGHGLGLLPAFVWLGIKMAPQTAIGFLLLSMGLLFYSYRSTLIAFGRLNFFNHMIIAFGFMTLLFIGMGSIVLTQIDSVSSIIGELYKNPLQVNNAAFRIKEEVGSLNRQLKDIAIQPELLRDIDIPQRITQVKENIQWDIALIHEKNNTSRIDLQQLEADLKQWHQFILMSYEYIRSGDEETYRLITLNEGQKKAIELEEMTEKIVEQAQNYIVELNTSAATIENNAKRLVIISICGFLSLGLLVAYLITRSLTNQLHQIRHAMLAIAHKQTDTIIPFLDHTQEIGDMARALAVFATSINAGRRMEVRMRQIIEAAPNGIVMISDHGMIEIVNQQAEKIFGYERSQLLGQSIELLVPKRMAHSHPKNRDDFFADPTPRAMGSGRELFGLRQDGGEFPLEIGLAPIETEDGLKVLASIVDISERKKSARLLVEHQLELEKSNRELARINKELETFAYVASHDLKSPLRGIAQLSSWIEEDLAGQEYANVNDHTRMLRSRILRMEKLLDDLLVFYRAGKMDNNLAVVDVKHIALELFEIQNTKAGLHLELAENLPTFTSLSTPFEQVLRNLFSNAIKHHDLDEGMLGLSCEDISEDFYAFTVCDDGPGVPGKYHERIFGMFQTLKPRDELEGSGMGLALIKKIVENYGGKISVHSEGRGTCFRFTWPKHAKGRATHV